MAPRAAQQQRPVSGLWPALAGIPAAVVLGACRLPASVGLLVTFTFAAWTAQPGALTGKKDKQGRPRAANDAEAKAAARFAGWRRLRWSMLDVRSCAPTKKLRLPFVWALIVGGLFALLPVRSGPMALINAGVAFLVVNGAMAARRAGMADGELCPGGFVADLPKAFELRRAVFCAAGGLLVGVGAISMPDRAFQWLGWGRANIDFDGVWITSNTYRLAFIAGVTALGWLGVASMIATSAALKPWHHLQKRRRRYAPDWIALGVDPEPRLIETNRVGPATVDVYRTSSAKDTAGMYSFAGKLSTVIDDGARGALVTVPNEKSSGEPVAGTIHPNKFAIVSWDEAEVPSLLDPSLPVETAELVVRSAISWTWGLLNIRPALTQLVALHGPDSRAALWMAVFGFTEFGGSYEETLVNRAAYIAAVGGGVYSIDNETGFALIGAPVDEVDWNDEAPISRDEAAHAVTDSEWFIRLNNSLKGGIQKFERVRQLSARHRWVAAGGVTGEMNVEAFVVNQGVDVAVYRGYEANFSTALSASLFVAVLGFPSIPGRVQGTRHPQALKVAWIEGAVPRGADVLMGSTEDAASTALFGGWLNAAFDAVRLARPEVRSASCVSAPASQKHLWRVGVQLYDGVTLGDVRRKMEALRTKLSIPYLRVTSAGSSDAAQIVMFIGEHHRSPQVTLIRPQTTQPELDRVDWEHGFIEAKIIGTDGLTPRRESGETLPFNDKVERVVFTLPGSVPHAMFKDKLDALKVSTGNAFIAWRKHPDATRAELYVSRLDPFPTLVPHDFDVVMELATQGLVPFATSIEGEPVCFNWRDSSFVLCIGNQGSGKLQPLDTRIPVPVSGRFPDGWAPFGELVVGDSVYAADGSIIPIVHVTEVVEEDEYLLTFDDGRTARCGPDHLWTASDGARRSGHLQRTRSVARIEAEATRIEAVAAKTNPALMASLETIGRLIGVSSNPFVDLGVRHLAVEVPNTGGRPSRTYSIDSVRSMVASGPTNLALLRLIAASNAEPGSWMSPGEIAESVGSQAWTATIGKVLRFNKMESKLLSRSASWEQRVYSVDAIRELARSETPEFPMLLTKLASSSSIAPGSAFTVNEACAALRGSSRHHVRQMLGIAGVERGPDRAGSRAMPLYPVAEVLRLYAASIRSRADGGPLERVVATREIANSITVPHGGGQARLNWALRIAEPIGGSHAVLPIDPYVLGVWLGDGTSRHGSVTSMDPEIIERCSSVFPVSSVDGTPDSRASSFRFIGMTAALRSAGLLGNKHVPSAYLRASVEQRLELLRGLMDTDGTVGTNGCCELTLSDQRLATDALSLMRSLGIKASMRSHAHTYKNNGVVTKAKDRHRIVFTPNHQVFSLSRKAERLAGYLGRTNRVHQNLQRERAYIVSCEPTGRRVPMRCIAVDHPDHLYLTDDFVPTHNTVFLQSIAYGAVAAGWMFFVSDPMKYAADFKYIKDRSTTFIPADESVGVDEAIMQTAAMLRHVYENEALPRKRLNAKHNVGNIADLPDDVRPPRIMIVIDEFNNLIELEPVERKAAKSDVEQIAENERIQRVNIARLEIARFGGKLAKEARSVGVQMVIGAQEMKSTDLDKLPGGKAMKGQMARILIGKADQGLIMASLRQPFDAPSIGDSPPKGRAIFESAIEAAKIVQTWFSPQDVLRQQVVERLPEIDPSRVLTFEVDADFGAGFDAEFGDGTIPGDAWGGTRITTEWGTMTSPTWGDPAADGDDELDWSAAGEPADELDWGAQEPADDELDWGDDGDDFQIELPDKPSQAQSSWGAPTGAALASPVAPPTLSDPFAGWQYPVDPKRVAWRPEPRDPDAAPIVVEGVFDDFR